MQKCTVTLKVSPGPRERGKMKPYGVGGGRETGQQASGDGPLEGIEGGVGVGIQPETQAQVGGLWD